MPEEVPGAPGRRGPRALQLVLGAVEVGDVVVGGICWRRGCKLWSHVYVRIYKMYSYSVTNMKNHAVALRELHFLFCPLALRAHSHLEVLHLGKLEVGSQMINHEQRKNIENTPKRTSFSGKDRNVGKK